MTYLDAISNETILTDFINTEKEADAYKELAHGFSVLAKLPENEGLNATMHNFYCDKYIRLENECRAFLEKLTKLRAERGI